MSEVYGLQNFLARSTVGALPPLGGGQPATRSLVPNPPVQTQDPKPPLQGRAPDSGPAKALEAGRPEAQDAESAAASQPRQATAWVGVGERAQISPGTVPEKELTFDEFVDAINPLQHIPVVSSIYRSITGDEISGASRIFGATLYGGPIGFGGAIAQAIFSEANDGQDVGETVIAALFGDEEIPVTDPIEGFAIARAGPGQLIAEAAQAPLATAAGPQLAQQGTDRMTGQAALDALADDLRGQAQPAQQQAENTNPQAPVIPVTPVSLDTAQSAPKPGGVAPGLADVDTVNSRGPAIVPIAATSADPQFIGAALRGDALADRMMKALDKYQTMSKGHGAVPPGRSLDDKF